MRSLSCVVLLGILHNCIQATNQCSPPNLWEHKEPAQRAEEAEKVILGTVIRGPCASKRNARESTAYSATFRVHCVIKGQSLPRFVNVSGFGAVDGTDCPTSTALLNKMYIAFLKGSNSIGDLTVHEVNSQVATIRIRHKGNNKDLRKIIAAVGRNVSLPVGSRNSSKPGCSVLDPHATNRSGSNKDHYNHNHMKRRKRKCRRRIKQKLTKSTTTLEATFKSTTELRFSDSHISLATTTTPTTRSGREDPDFEALAGSGSGSLVQSSWYLMMTFHSLVSLVVKYRQT